MALHHAHHYVLALLACLVLLAYLGTPPVFLLVLPILTAGAILSALLRPPPHRPC